MGVCDPTDGRCWAVLTQDDVLSEMTVWLNDFVTHPAIDNFK